MAGKASSLLSFLFHIVCLPLPEANSLSSLASFGEQSNYSSSSTSVFDVSKSIDLYESKKILVFERIRQALEDNKLAQVTRCDLPEFKIGTLDSLIAISDELVGLDCQFEAIALRLVNNLKNLLSAGPSPSEPLESHLLINNQTPDRYITTFEWNLMKYRHDRPIPEIVANLSQEVSQIESTVKNKMSYFNQSKSSMAVIERKKLGNLSVKNLADVVNEKDFIQDSEFLETILVAVPQNLQREFLNSYETLSPMVVPRSAVLITQDDDFALYSVLVFKKTASEFRAKAREAKFTIRDFTFNVEQLASERKQQEILAAQLKEQWSLLFRLVKTNIGEVFSAWIHLKVIRAFVECVLRYGLPPIYMSALARPLKDDKKLRSLIIESVSDLRLPGLSSNLGSFNNYKNKSENFTAEGIALEYTSKEYLPYVQIDIKWSTTAY